MQEKVMVLKAQAMQEDNELYDYFTKDFTFCQCISPLLMVIFNMLL
jgi:hypothetical protein